MRLNAVWGLEPEANAQDIQLAHVQNDMHGDGGVIYDCVEKDRQPSVIKLGDSKLDEMILMFQSQPEDDHYFIYCIQNAENKDPYDLRPLVEYKTKTKQQKITT
jgi:hypothetical protein